ncbi:MAG: hypothetical protein M3309_02645, partial [Actinomycetota bacterium]|nr:hypothetical protein [Actinomycetota bacterium]
AMIFHTIGHREPGDEGLEAIHQQEEQRISEGASCFVCGGPLEFPFIRWAGPDSQVDLHPDCALHMGVRLMRDVNEVEDKYGPMTAPPGSGHDPQGRTAAI